MARWGEGDPRWIVEERPDATNVNNWHWTEKNACGWSKDKFKELLLGLELVSDIVDVRITELEKIDGEAVANNRKGKLIFFYEWDITLVWHGKLKDSTVGHEGKIRIPNLSEENSLPEIEVSATLKESTPEGEIIKEYLHHHGCEKVREKLGVYISSLKEEFAKGMLLPRKDSEGVNETNKESQQIKNVSKGLDNKVRVDRTNNQSTNSAKIDTTNLQLTETFQCRGEDFYNAMTRPEMVSAFTNGPAVVEPKVGGIFQLFDGNITGEFVELEQDKKIVQKWRLKAWPQGHFSTVTLVIDQQEDHTVVKISQTGIPQSDTDGLKANWSRYYWDNIKRTFAWGYFM